MAQVIRLTGARVALSPARAEQIDLQISRGRILPFDAPVSAAVEYDLSGHLLLPGLINAHDHLEFNLFPRLGGGVWPNAHQWAAAIYRPDSSPVKEHRTVPRAVRIVWGGIRNLLCGVTTVAHHNPWEPEIFRAGFPVRVVRKQGWAHSLHFSPDIEQRHRETPADWPFIVHAAEGTDACAQSEISRLEAIGILDHRTVLVHAVGISSSQLENIRACGASIVWCPSSNLFTLGATLPHRVIHEFSQLALGTDSALTAEGDMIDEIRVAEREAGLRYGEIYPMVTTNAARALRLTAGQGTIREEGVADLVAVRDIGQTPAEALRDLRAELVLSGGRIMLMSQRFARAAKHAIRGMHSLEVEDRGRYMIRANISQLWAAATNALGEQIRLSGKRVCP
jgi:cytosine/adenosine deaminase-related metal-dependent hydrolase